MSIPDLGKVGVWSAALRFGDAGEIDKAAAELDEIGYGAIWIPGGIDDAVLNDISRMLKVTKRLVLATGIINLWKQEAHDVAAWFKALPDEHRNRVMLGIGISHAPLIGAAWNNPVARTRDYLERLEAAGMAMDHTCLAALGPKMMALAGERTAGAHPYLTTPEHTAEARRILGPGKLLAPEQGVIFESDRDRLREVAKAGLSNYLQLPNYRNSWLRLGFSEKEDIDPVSDRFIDAIFAHGSVDAMAARVKAHHDAGADHVCVQVIAGAMGSASVDNELRCYRELAKVLL
ncbi:MAG: TIGR03620 family F420-dependent LLM class oxidoreductase [Novosphingobium sp.]|nr:TIGR03620 family F420-dependent LLM class oxidoreductase [Novosphingobium sp.]